MTLAGEEAARRIEADPSGARHERLGPRVEIDDVARDALGLVGDHAFVGELDQISGCEARRDPASTQQRHEQHRAVAAAATALDERLLGRPDSGLVADHVRHAFANTPADLDEQAHGVAARRQLLQEVGREPAEAVRGIAGVEEARELGHERIRIGERRLLRAIVDEEIERIDRTNVDRELHHDRQLGDRMIGLERDACDVVAVRIALPVHAMLGSDLERVGLDPRARVIGGPQPDQLWAEQRRT